LLFKANQPAEEKLLDVTEGVDIETLDAERTLESSKNSLEFLLLSLAKALDVTPRQAAALLTNSNKYLIAACFRGVKGGFH